jgi:uncharacterized protein
MTTAILCTALLGLLVFGLGLRVSLARGRTKTFISHATDPSDPLHKAVRAHANATEYAPMLSILMLAIGARGPSTWMLWVFVAATIARYLHAIGMLASASLDQAQPLRFVGALGTYVCGMLLVLAAFLSL